MKADGVLANITRVVLALTMCFTFPLDFFVVRYTIQRAIQRCTNDKWDGDEPYQLGNSNRNGQILAFSPVFTRSNLRGKGHASDLKLCYHFIFTSTVWIVCLCKLLYLASLFITSIDILFIPLENINCSLLF